MTERLRELFLKVTVVELNPLADDANFIVASDLTGTANGITVDSSKVPADQKRSFYEDPRKAKLGKSLSIDVLLRTVTTDRIVLDIQSMLKPLVFGMSIEHDPSFKTLRNADLLYTLCELIAISRGHKSHGIVNYVEESLSDENSAAQSSTIFDFGQCPSEGFRLCQYFGHVLHAFPVLVPIDGHRYSHGLCKEDQWDRAKALMFDLIAHLIVYPDEFASMIVEWAKHCVVDESRPAPEINTQRHKRRRIRRNLSGIREAKSAEAMLEGMNSPDMKQFCRTKKLHFKDVLVRYPASGSTPNSASSSPSATSDQPLPTALPTYHFLRKGNSPFACPEARLIADEFVYVTPRSCLNFLFVGRVISAQIREHVSKSIQDIRDKYLQDGFFKTLMHIARQVTFYGIATTIVAPETFDSFYPSSFQDSKSLAQLYVVLSEYRRTFQLNKPMQFNFNENRDQVGFFEMPSAGNIRQVAVTMISTGSRLIVRGYQLIHMLPFFIAILDLVDPGDTSYGWLKQGLSQILRQVGTVKTRAEAQASQIATEVQNQQVLETVNEYVCKYSVGNLFFNCDTDLENAALNQEGPSINWSLAFWLDLSKDVQTAVNPARKLLQQNEIVSSLTGVVAYAFKNVPGRLASALYNSINRAPK